MKPAFKTILASAVVLVIGAAVLDFGGWDILGKTLTVLGGLGIVLGPLAQSLE